MKHSILTVKSGTEFSCEHVNILFRATKGTSSWDFQFICMTDDPKGVENNIISLTIPMSRLDTFPKTENAWSKLCLFYHKLPRRSKSLYYWILTLCWPVTLIRSLTILIGSPNAKLGPKMETVDPSFEPMGTTGVFTYRLSFHTIIFDAFRKDLELASRNNVLIEGLL